MEIFEGTYMRPRYSPCQANELEANMAKTRAFFGFKRYLGVLILVSITKNGSIREYWAFGAKQAIILVFAVE